MTDIVIDRDFDARGLNCPIPLVKARQEIRTMEVGQVLRVTATDRGSVKDFEGWARIAGNIELLSQEARKEGDTDVYVHVLRRTG